MENAPEQMLEMDGRISKNWDEIVKMEERVSALSAETAVSQAAANTLSQSLSEIQQRLTAVNDQTTSMTTHFNDYFAKVDPAIKTKYETVTEHHGSVDQFLKAATELKRDLEEYREYVYGNETLGKLGYKKEVEALFEANKAANEKLSKEWLGNYNTLFAKIEGLLPGATSTGLSKAYEDQKTNYKGPVILWSCVFSLAVLGMMGFGFWAYSEVKDLNDSLRHILARLPFFIPAIWLAIFAGKQQSKYVRLQQEYIYKETLAKSYEAYKREIDNLPASEEKNILHQKLITSMVEMCGFNPSLTLEHKSHTEKPPFPGEGIIKKLLGKESKAGE